ncbi:hypothetical protein [Methylocaldum szegediense]|uniref:Uncharacterized protein n=1 Tax=Methylocaldum szegediense TaxID=73780 RepID=A0ABN8X5Z9_9GAMM|nr:hypothetical protein [Methylocaldum szegediense]CAI8799915.1 protein of unknown function [Methylocaldum szegediense]
MRHEIRIRSLITLVLLVLAFQGNAVFSFLVEGLQIFVEVVERVSGHLLETRFGLSTRAARAVIAGFGLTVCLALTPFIVRKIRAVLGGNITLAMQRRRERRVLPLDGHKRSARDIG